MNISPKSEIYFFNSYGKERMKHFIVSDDKIIVEKILKGIEAIYHKDKKADTLQAKIFNECLQETKGNQNQKNFRKCS